TGLGPKPAETPDAPWGQLMNDFKNQGVRPDEIDMVVMTHLHRDHVGWNLKAEAGKYAPTFPRARYWMPKKDWESCHDPALQQTRKALLDRLEREQILVAAGHFEAPGYGRIVRLEGRRYWKGL